MPVCPAAWLSQEFCNTCPVSGSPLPGKQVALWVFAHSTEICFIVLVWHTLVAALQAVWLQVLGNSLQGLIRALALLDSRLCTGQHKHTQTFTSASTRSEALRRQAERHKP